MPRNTALGYGAVPYVTWHKKESENIVAAAGIEVEKPPEDGFTPQKAAGINAETHVGIVESYALGMSMAATALKYGVSSATVKSHVWRHNDAVARETRCGICAAEGSALAGEAVNVRR